MTAKIMLRQLIWLRHQIERIDNNIEEIRETMTSAGAIRYDKINVQVSASNDELADFIDRLEHEERLARAYRLKYFRIYNECLEIIRNVERPLEREVLSYYYIDGIRLKEIAKTMDYSEDYIRQVHRIALKRIDEKLKDNTQ